MAGQNGVMASTADGDMHVSGPLSALQVVVTWCAVRASNAVLANVPLERVRVQADGRTIEFLH